MSTGLLLALLAYAAPPAPPVVAAREVVGSDAVTRRPRFEIQGHAARLTPSPSGPLTLDSGTPDQARWDVLDFDPVPGGRLAATFPGARRDVSLAFTWWGSWSDEDALTGSLASTAAPGAPLNLVGGIGVAVREATSLADFELTSERPWRASARLAGRWGLGLRYAHLEEQASFLFPTSVPVANAAVYTTRITSGLLAAEATGSVAWRFASRLSLTARGTLLAGWMQREGTLTTTNVTPTPSPAGHDQDDLGYGAEAELALAWQAGPRLSLSLGWGALLLGPVSRAHAALDFSRVASNDLGPRFPGETLLVQRLFVGLAFDL